MIDDIGAVESSNILQFAGVSNFFAGESFAMRGARIGYPLLDEMPDGAPYLDNINLDSYTVMRGPAATLYLNASLGGTVITTSFYGTGEVAKWQPALEATIAKAHGVALRVPPPPNWMYLAWGGAGLVIGWLVSSLVLRKREGA